MSANLHTCERGTGAHLFRVYPCEACNAAARAEKNVCPHGMSQPWSAYWGPCRFCEPPAEHTAAK